jgi:hypothetical protein
VATIRRLERVKFVQYLAPGVCVADLEARTMPADHESR